MSWYKKALQREKTIEEWEDGIMKSLALGKYAPTEAEQAEMSRKKEERIKENDGECLHSMDVHCDGSGDDGW